MTSKEYEQHIKKVPQDPVKFVQYLKDNEGAVFEHGKWVGVWNIKYNTVEHKHYTFFYPSAEWNAERFAEMYDIDKLFQDLSLYINCEANRSVEAIHFHLTESDISGLIGKDLL